MAKILKEKEGKKGVILLQSRAWELCGTIYHFCHLPYKYFSLLHQCQLAAFILQRQIQFWFAFLELEELPTMTNIVLVLHVWASRHLHAVEVFSFCFRLTAMVLSVNRREKIMWGVQYLLWQWPLEWCESTK